MENSDAELDQVVAAIVDAIIARAVDREAAMREVRAPAGGPATAFERRRPSTGSGRRWRLFSPGSTSARHGAWPRGLRPGRDGRRRDRPASRRAGRHRAASHRPRFAGLSDAASWQLRRLLVESAPAEVAGSLTDLAAEATEAWALRELLADVAPAEVAASLEGLDDETAWALRAELYPRVPEAVLSSLALLDVPRAWEFDGAGSPNETAWTARPPATCAHAPWPAR